MYLCVAHGNDGAMEVSLVFCIDEISSPLTVAAAMLRYRLHFTHRGQRNGASQLTTSVPITVRVIPSFWPALTSLRRINIPPPSHRHFGSLARRLGRIFAHAYFHHREVFEQAEAESSLYNRFLTLTVKFDLVPPEFLIIPTPSGLSDDPEPPRLHAAAVDPQHQSGSDDENDDRGRGTQRGLGMDILGGIDRNPSPRKGRNRTGTMIFSEALIMAEELTKGGDSPSPERDPVVQIPEASTEIPESEGDFVHVDVSNREGEEEEEEEEEEHHEEEHDSPPDSPTEGKSSFGLDDDLEEEHMPTLSEIHTHVETIQDDQAPEQDVTDDAEDTVAEDDDDEAPEHDVTSAHEPSGTTIIELSPAEDIDTLEEEAQEEDLTEAVVEPQYEDDDAADAEEVAEQIALDEPHDQPDAS